MSEREAFEQILNQDPDDDVTRLVFADWLMEHDEPEEADRMRRWRASKTWLEDWCRSVNYGKWEYDDEGEYLLDAKGERVPAKKDNLGDPHTFEHCLDAGHYAARGETYCWGSDAAHDYFFTQDYEPDEPAIRDWLYHWSTVTGVPLARLEHVVEQVPFRCAC